jgi:triosephosphate isomerase
MNTREKIVIGNWKMNKVYIEGLLLANAVISELEKQRQYVDVVLCPPFIHIQTIYNMLKEHIRLHVGAQNCHESDSGAFTGEVSAAMLASVGAGYIITGHSERRTYYHEDHLLISKKVKTILKNNLIPVFCCGENLETRQNNLHETFVLKQLEDSLFDLSPEQIQKVIIAYEPIWAIGTGVVASTEQAESMHLFIRKTLAEKFSEPVAEKLRIIYGGSCNAGNAADLFKQPNIDGALVGGASLTPSEFLQIIKLRTEFQ